MIVYVFKKINKILSFKNKRYYTSSNPNLLKFERVESFGVLKDEDLFNLFRGFVSLIKKSVRAELEQAYKKKLNYYQLKIQNLLSKIK